MHRGYYPLVDNQPMVPGGGFRRTRAPQTEPGADGRPPDNRHPMDKAIEHLTKAFPLETSEWSAWSAAMQPPKLAGRWAIVGTQPGKGPVYGQMIVTADASAPDAFNTEIKYTIARTGETVSRPGKALIYTGYQWRGRGASPGPFTALARGDVRRARLENHVGTLVHGRLRRDGNRRAARAPGRRADGVWHQCLRAQDGYTGSNVKIFGVNLPADIKTDDIGAGLGVKVTRIAAARPDEIDVEVDVTATAPIGARDLSVAGTVKPGAIVVYNRIDGLKVAPQSGMARVGGVVFPKQFQQFEAIGYSNGPDGKPDTADDLNLGAVPVKWSIEEYTATFGDDDAQYVGTIDQSGLFTPNVDGPNPKRTGNRNNVGDVWVVAELTGPDASANASRPLRARGQLLVTVPLYMAWFESEGGK